MQLVDQVCQFGRYYLQGDELSLCIERGMPAFFIEIKCSPDTRFGPREVGRVIWLKLNLKPLRGCGILLLSCRDQTIDLGGKPLSLQDFVAADHLEIGGGGDKTSFVDRYLVQEGLTRRVRMNVPFDV